MYLSMTLVEVGCNFIIKGGENIKVGRYLPSIVMGKTFFGRKADSLGLFISYGGI